MPQDDRPITLEEFEEQRRKHYGIPSGLAASLRQQESGGRQYDQGGGVLTSPKQARGRYQVLKSTAAKYDLNPDDPFENVEASFRYLSDLNKQVDAKVTDPGERWAQTLAGYHAGEGRLREVNKTGALPSTSDGKIRTDEYVSNIMNRWQQHDQGRSGRAAPVEATQTQSTARRLGLKPAEGTRFDLSGGPPSVRRRVQPMAETFAELGFPEQPQPKLSRRQARPKAPSSDQQIADIEHQMRQRDMKEPAIAETRARLAKLSPADLTKETARLTKIFATVPETRPARLEEERRRAEYYAKPLYERVGREILGGAAETGAGISRAMRRVSDPIGRALGYGAEIDVERAREAESERQLAEETAIANRMQSRIVRGLSAGGTQLATLAPVAALTGPAGVTALTALESDIERDPGGALTGTIAAPLSMAAGRFISPAAARAGGALSSRPAQIAAQRGIEGLAGAGVNVGQYAGTSAALGRPITAEDIAEQAIVGGGLGIAAAPRRPQAPRTLSGVDPTIIEAAARARPGLGYARPFEGETPRQYPRVPLSRDPRFVELGPEGLSAARTPEGAIITPESQIRRRLLPPAVGEESLPTEPLSRAVREVIGQPDPRFYPRPPVEPPSPRTPGGAIIAQPSSLPSRKLLPPAQTQRLQYPEVPETQEMPAFRERLRAEEAPTAEIPRIPTAPEQPRRTAEIPRVARGLVAPETPPELGLTPGRPTPRLPKATDENIQALRARQEELGRLAYDRRGDFTGDLRDEYNRLTSLIRDYNNAKAVQARGGRLEPAPPPGMRPERMTPPPEEREARRAALQPRTGPMPEVFTPGRKVTQEVQVPRGLKAAESHVSREDARQGHFERFSDEELVGEIRRMEDVRNQAIRGRSKLSREELEANNFDLKVAVGMQKERTRIQRQIGVEAGERIAPRTPGRPAGRKIQHTTFGEVIEVPNQKGVPTGKLRVMDADGAQHLIQNPRTRGNREAAFVKSTGPVAEPALPMEQRGQPDILRGMKKLARTPTSPVEVAKLREQFPGMAKADFDAAMTKLNEEGRIALHRHDHPASLSEADRANLVKIGNDYFTAATIRERPGQVMGMGLGGLQGLKRGAKPAPEQEGVRKGFIRVTEGGKTYITKAPRGRFIEPKAPKPPKTNPTPADIESAGLGRALGNLSKGVGNEMRTLMTAIDFGAVGAQGFWLSASHSFKAITSGARMFRSLSRSQSDAIDAAIEFHPLRKLWEKADMYTATAAKLKGEKAGGEEAYRGMLARVPVVRGFERAYRTYLDALRVSVFESYAKALSRQGITFENNPKAYKDVASFINIASGRGQLKRGGMLEGASDLMGAVTFAPRNLIANFQILDPVRYARMEPAARKLALRDSLTTLGAIVGTAVLLRQAGVRVGFNVEDDDFMIARVGNTRYDLTFGKKTQVQFLARLIAGTYRQATGEGNLPGKDPLSVAKSFAEGKASPLLSAALTFGRGRTYAGKKLADMSRGEIAYETAPVPLLAKDLIDAYREEGKAGVVKTLPAVIGTRVKTYSDRAKATFIETPADLHEEQKRAGEPRSFLNPRRAQDKTEQDETPAAFAARKTNVDEWTKEYGSQLVNSPAYQSATAEQKAAAREYLKEQIVKQSDERRPSLYLFRPSHILQTVREGERRKRREAARR